MKIWDLRVPVVGECAQFYNYYIQRKVVGTCTKCGRKQYSPPLNYIEGKWEEGSDKICDFVFAVGPIILRSQIADDLLEHFSGFTKGEIRMPDLPTLHKPKRITKRTKKRVWLPYEGPELCWMQITKEVDLDPTSTVEVESSCEECGLVYREFVGIEERGGSLRTPRQRGKGLFVDQSALGGADFFRPKYTGFTLCTDRAKEFIVKRGYGNIDFLEVGDLLCYPKLPDRRG